MLNFKFPGDNLKYNIVVCHSFTITSQFSAISRMCLFCKSSHGDQLDHEIFVSFDVESLFTSVPIEEGAPVL